MEPLIAGDPQSIGDYWLSGRLGAGGQGVVYEAYGPDGERVAVKVLHAADHDRSRERFAKEALAAGRVASFCTARVLAADLEGRKPYIVSEYVAGPSLRKAVTEGRRFTGDDLHRLAAAIATALTAVHDAGVIHRDLKPDNVLLSPDGPRVIDFGIARTLDMSLTRTGEVSGTPSYMAPEVFTGHRAGAAADVFAWGAVLLFAATGRDPFSADNLGGIMHQVLSSQPDLRGLPPLLASLVGAAMDKDPAARPAARDLLLALVSGNGADTRGLLDAGSRTARGVHVPDRPDPALGTIAEDAYGALPPEDRDLAAEVFLRLVSVGEDGHETGRWATRDELLGGRPEREAVAIERILRAFSYVVTTKDEAVALSRPALLRAWPRLRMWVDADRDGLAVLGQISAAARHWADHGRRDGDLLQGSRLEEALSWAATGRRNVTLTPRERDFLQAGTGLTRRRARRRTLTTTGLAGLLVVALAAGGVAVYQGRQAAAQRDVLAAKQVAGEADRMRTTDPAKAMLLSVAAWKVAPQSDARSALTASAQQQETAVFHDPSATGGAQRALSRDGRTMVSVSDGGVNVYDVRTGRRTGGWQGLRLTGTLSTPPRLSRTGRYLAQSTTDKLGVWDMRTGRQLLQQRLPEASFPLLPTWGEREEMLTISFEGDNLHRIIDVESGKQITAPPEGGPSGFHDPIVDPTGRHLLVPGEKLHELALPSLTEEHRLPDCHKYPEAVAFSPDGRKLACGYDLIKFVDAGTGRELNPNGDGIDCTFCKGGAVLRFSRDGRYLLGFSDRDLAVWDVATGRDLLVYRAEGDLTDVAFDPDGKTVRYLMDDAVVSVDFGPQTERVHVIPGHSQLSANGRIAVLTPDDDSKQIQVWDVRTRKVLGSLPMTGNPGAMMSIDASGTRMITVGDDVRLWDLTTRRKLWTVRLPEDNGSAAEAFFAPDGKSIAMTMHQGEIPLFHNYVMAAADGHVLHHYETRMEMGPITSDGRTFASSAGRLAEVATGKQVGGDFGGAGALVLNARRGLMAGGLDRYGRLGLWDLHGPRRLSPALPRAAGEVQYTAFSPSGDLLATVTNSGLLQVWDVDGRRRLGNSYNLHTINPDPIAFSADGATLYAPAEGVVHEVAVDPSRLVQRVCARTGHTLDEATWAQYFPGSAYVDVCPTKQG
ncbi:WD40 repeat domain-containing serine/threonine-protein kinase [Nonomuraea sediminis]|uniref:WD40 repeat domain-containing serine/threonine-protein kinase n=1 Tax=Nonomuraea sediminis TaxID=2835864 RepID=UPI001BDBD853|nr:WD40 repeat domain-containing serine/threonine-protein kinase [Nonomuraea sediminis]